MTPELTARPINERSHGTVPCDEACLSVVIVYSTALCSKELETKQIE